MANFFCPLRISVWYCLYLNGLSTMKHAALAHQIVGSTFGFYSPDDIRKISVKKIDSVQTFDALGNPVKNGLYDPALGPMDSKHGNCTTCGLSEAECPGHFGHIELPVPIYNPIVFSPLLKLIKLVCFNCHKFRIESKKTKRFAELLHLINCGKLDVARELENFEEKNPEDYATDKKKNSSQKSADIKFLVDRLKTLEDFDLDLSSEDVLREQVTKNMLNYRKELVIKYLKAIPTEKCHNCGAFKIALKKDGLKLFQKRLSETNARLMGAQGITYRSPLSNAQDDNADDDTSKWLFNQPKESENMEVLEEDPMDVDDDKDARKKKSKKSKKTKKGKEEKDEDDPEGEETDEKGKKKKKAKKDEEATNTIRKARGKKLNPADDVTQRLMSPLEVREHMKLLWNNEQEIIKLIYSSLVKDTEGAKTRISSHDIFFLEVIAVPPTRFRPPAEHNGQLTEHAQNVYLSKVLNIINQMEIYKKQGTNVKVGAYTDLWNQLQNSIQLMMDNTPGPANKNPPGIKQLLEKKEGLFRKNMMGKRVDFAARSVISPDPYIETNEIGVPLYFAKTLNYPEPVTAHNVAWLRKLVMNGPLKHPGANKIEDEFGNVIVLPPHDDARRAGFAKTLTKPNISSQYGFGVKKVYRHLMDGDFLLVNRQPTLHKPSIMAHKARILGLENTIQMHYANCNTYNADFDGDEMNLHFPQSELSRAEASQIVITDQQYVVPKDGSPLRGLIQDHIVSGVYLTCRDTFLTRDRFQQLFFGCCWNTNPKVPLTMPTPAVLKPQRLWTGKQLITAVLNQLTHGKRPLNLVSKSQIPDEMWGKGSGEATIIIRQNHLLTGVLGKKQFGNKAHGLVHAVYELYGAEMAGKLLTTLGRLFTLYLQFRGFTCGMDDLLLTLPAEKKRAALAEESSRCGMKQAGIFTGIIPQDDPDMLDKIKDKAERRAMEQKIMTRLSEMLASPDEAHNWDKFMISHLGGVTSSIIEACLPHGQVKAFPKNNLAMMTISGAKGSRVNFSQISCLLGQQELEGRRVPRMVTGQTLPCFAPYDTSPLAGGFVANRFLTGVNPVEYFFHCMAGREGLIDTAVKTSRSGYLQRCIIKHMESLTVSYDHTVRDHDGSVIQFYYGDDGIDVMKTGFLYEFDFLSENMHILMDSYDIKRAATLPLVSKKDKKRAMKKKDHYDPVLNKYSPGVYLGAVSEKFENAILNYIEKNPEKFSKTPNKHQIDPDMFRQMMYLKYIHSLANPGEAVGVLAGQSIGEPSTQMTLNTFHLAGKGEVNVTLGIPRMRELILTGGSTTTTPSMILPLKKECGLKEAQNVAARLARSMLIEVLDDIVVKESLDTVNSGHVRVYDINVTFKDIDKKSYSWRFFKNVMEQKILPNFLRKISEILKIKKGQIIGKSDMSNFDEEIIKDIQGAADDEAAPRGQKEKGGNDDDGYSSIQRSKKKDFATYDEADDDEKEMVGKQDEDEEFDDVDEEDDKKQDQDGKDEENNNSNEENIEDKKMNQKMSHECLKSYSFSNKEHSLSMVLHVPADKPKLLIVSLLEEIAEISAVRAVKNIKRCFVIKPNKDDSRYKIQTEGINFESIWRLSNLVEMKDIYTNHVPTIAATYGIEAARASMVSEIGSVFKAYGITVDPRHLALVGDSMCFEGVIKAMNRGGINSNTSPYLKMSFETTMAFLTDAAIHGDYDRIESPSAQITLGRLSRTGTGAFDVRHDLTYLERHKPKA